MFSTNNDYGLMKLHQQRVAESERKAEQRRLLDEPLPKRVRRRKIQHNRTDTL